MAASTARACRIILPHKESANGLIGLPSDNPEQPRIVSGYRTVIALANNAKSIRNALAKLATFVETSRAVLYLT